ncbi:MAG: DUF3450 domain-containing protein [Pseudomonadota bacterium]
MMKKIAFMGSVALLALGGMSPAQAQFSAAINESQAAANEGKRSQQRIDNLDDAVGELLGEYSANLRQRDVSLRYNAGRAREIENQLVQIEQLQQDVENIEGLQRAILPLLEEMLGRLEQFIAADTPFLLKERNDRLTRLRSVMSDSTQTPASRYGLIMEAYQIENEYGRTIESYSDVVDNGGEDIVVDFLRIGRLALIYKNSDDTILRIYNPEAGQFEDLDMKYLSEVRRGIRMANEQVPPDLLQIPVRAPQTAGQAQ